jgi:hypothetical protein
MTSEPVQRVAYREEGAVHLWFGLTYANYAVLHRTLLQSMPLEWQDRFVACLRELDESFGHLDIPGTFMVQAKDRDGRFIKDPVPHYNRGRTFVPPGAPAPGHPPPPAGAPGPSAPDGTAL